MNDMVDNRSEKSMGKVKCPISGPAAVQFLKDANEILMCLKTITDNIAETTRLEAIKREWRLAAGVIDRIFMYISIALFIVFNFLMAILAPNTPMSVISIY